MGNEKKKIIELQRDNAFPIISMILGLMLGMFGYFIFKNESTGSYFSLIIIIPALLIFFFGLWSSTELLIIRGDILAKSNLFGLIKRERDLKNLKAVKRSEGNLFRSPSNNILVLLQSFLSNPKYSNFKVLELRFENEKRIGLSELSYERKDFTNLSVLLKRHVSKNRKRFRKISQAK